MIIVKKCLYILLLITFWSCNNDQSTNKNTAVNKTNNDHISDTTKIKNILFFGNSLAAGYGLDDQQEAFPSLIQNKIDSLGLSYKCINAGLSGETSAGGNERIDWLLKQPVDVFVLELGANDGLRGINPKSTYLNLSAIITKVLKANPDCKLILAGMKVPPNMGNTYFKEFEDIFPNLAKEFNMSLIPFLLDKVAGIPKLNQSDGIHPTKEGHIILAENTWSILEPLL